jgi:hypothetical protein
VVGVRVQALPGEKEVPERPDVIFLEVFPVRILFLIARNAVGAVKRTETPCCEMTRQKAPGSGVPTGFPS